MTHETFVLDNIPTRIGSRACRARAVSNALRAVAMFADAHDRDGSPIGDDYIAAPIMADMLRGVVHMLNFDIRPIEAATFDRLARQLAVRIGLTEDLEVK